MVFLIILEPHFSLRYSASCGTCHIARNGGGMRTEEGYSFQKKLPIMKVKEISTDINDVRFGLSSALLVANSSTFPFKLTPFFVPMQADLYLLADIEKINIYFKGGINNFEIQGIFGEDFYLRIGRFYPPILRFKDHTNFVMDKTIFGFRRGMRPDFIGLEGGYETETFFSAFGGGYRSLFGTVVFFLQRLLFGFSLYSDLSSHFAFGYLGFGFKKFFTLLEMFAVPLTKINGISTTELRFSFLRGFDFVGKFDISPDEYRISFGFEIFPINYISLYIMQGYFKSKILETYIVLSFFI